jgi:hypothetical protein
MGLQELFYLLFLLIMKSLQSFPSAAKVSPINEPAVAKKV